MRIGPARAPLAKLTRPAAADFFPRERLFNLLDQVRKSPAIWILGPAGAGKTSLVASYLESRRHHSIWYQLDADDADASTFFHYLGIQARAALGKKGKPLPHLTPEYLPDLDGFARRYFRDLFGRLAAPFAFVLDNYQEVPADSTLHRVIGAALSEMPGSATAVLLSRSEPPPTLAHWYANSSVIGWQELRLTRNELAGFAKSWGYDDPEVLPPLYEVTQGWAAGTVLMLRAHSEGMQVPMLGKESPAAIFDYFAGEIFARTSETIRNFLLKTAFLPTMTIALAEQLTGLRQAGRVLSELNRNHFFTERRASAVTTFEYHPLFRDFLLTRAREIYPAHECRQLERRAASLLEAHGQAEQAVSLYFAAGDLSTATKLILKQAPGLLAQGRQQTLQGWINAMPQDTVEASPWLLDWLGACELQASPLRARQFLERAFEGFTEQHDILGQVLTTSRVLRTFKHDRSGFAEADPWIATMEKLLVEGRPLLPTEVDFEVLSVLVWILFFRQPAHPLYPVWVDRLMKMLDSDVTPDEKVDAGLHLLMYYRMIGNIAKADRVVMHIRPLLALPEVRGWIRIWWWAMEAQYRFQL
ncbi:MAG TPA: hypothetical protein VLA73_03805, partial [Burkholderiales bacterium]|nr:hypothetical protein [Burkholderiales bacterium]